ncbi:MAG: short-chain fatty acid transporter [Flavobacteriaceae bacterium]|nr:short-chain fatty acid transporter [Flavobacteriaceae bacterium]MBT5011748.1 short-chain fatty acid transporter [Flavobacteriaceae bacterium]
MLLKFGEKFTDIFKRIMPDSFVFALLLTLVTGLSAVIFVNSNLLEILDSWYKGFWELLEFGMQITLIIVTGYSIALSSFTDKILNKVSQRISSPLQVYLTVIILGVLLSMISWGMVVIVAVLARELALRVKGINYPFLIACTYLSFTSWVTGLSSSIPLLMNTKNNFLIKEGVLNEVIPTSLTLGSNLNFIIIFIYVIIVPFIIFILIPKSSKNKELKDLIVNDQTNKEISIEEEANLYRSKKNTFSDKLNHSRLLQNIIFIMGICYLIYYFNSNGFDLNLNIMIFIFIILGLVLHQTPKRYAISMKRASNNVYGIIFQFPFYAGIMGIMLYTGLGESFSNWIASNATISNFPYYSYLIGGLVNFAIPSGGGEFAVIGPSIIEAAKQLAISLPPEQMTKYIARTALSIAYGESLTNLLQPFFLLIVLPVMGSGTRIEARDVMGYLAIPFLILFILESLLILYMPI